MIQVQPTEGPFGLIIAPSRELAHQTYEAGCRWRGGDGLAILQQDRARSTWFSEKQSASGGVSNFISTGCIGCRCWLGLVVWCCLDLYLVSRWSSSIQITLQSTTRNFQSYDQRLPQHWLLASHWWVTDESLMSLEMSGDHMCYGCVWAWDVSMYTPKSPSNPAKMMKQDETRWNSETYWNIMILSGFCLGFPWVSVGLFKTHLEIPGKNWGS